MGRCHRRTCERWPPTPVGLELGPFKDRPARAPPTYAAEPPATTATPLNAACGSTVSRDRCRPRATPSPAPSVSGVGDLHPVHPWGTFDPMVPLRGGARGGHGGDADVDSCCVCQQTWCHQGDGRADLGEPQER